jgi:hypothetical protein
MIQKLMIDRLENSNSRHSYGKTATLRSGDKLKRVTSLIIRKNKQRNDEILASDHS